MNKRPILDHKIMEYVEMLIEAERAKLGSYPAKITLSNDIISKVKKAIKNYELDLSNSWADLDVLNYRGIIIKEL